MIQDWIGSLFGEALRTNLPFKTVSFVAQPNDPELCQKLMTLQPQARSNLSRITMLVRFPHLLVEN